LCHQTETQTNRQADPNVRERELSAGVIQDLGCQWRYERESKHQWRKEPLNCRFHKVSRVFDILKIGFS
jgi:hypothetical protein